MCFCIEQDGLLGHVIQHFDGTYKCFGIAFVGDCFFKGGYYRYDFFFRNCLAVNGNQAGVISGEVAVDCSRIHLNLSPEPPQKRIAPVFFATGFAPTGCKPDIFHTLVLNLRCKTDRNQKPLNAPVCRHRKMIRCFPFVSVEGSGCLLSLEGEGEEGEEEEGDFMVFKV